MDFQDPKIRQHLRLGFFKHGILTCHARHACSVVS
jgi:hypothetical protein